MGSQESSKPETGRGWTGDQIDRIIGNLLRFGLLISAAIVLIGAAIFLAHHGGEKASYSIFRGAPRNYREIKSILAETVQFHGRGFIMVGLILLIATPVARVAFSVLAFLRKRDYVFSAVTIFVLSILLFSIFWLGLR
jgi:uncharacterized membrane protein